MFRCLLVLFMDSYFLVDVSGSQEGYFEDSGSSCGTEEAGELNGGSTV